MRTIDADYLKNLPFERLIHTDFGDTAVPIEEIDNAPTVITDSLYEAYCKLNDEEFEHSDSFTVKTPKGKIVKFVQFVIVSGICGDMRAKNLNSVPTVVQI